jgi:hypothetical protein
MPTTILTVMLGRYLPTPGAAIRRGHEVRLARSVDQSACFSPAIDLLAASTIDEAWRLSKQRRAET